MDRNIITKSDAAPTAEPVQPDPAAGLSWWQREPALVIAGVTAVVDLAVTFGVRLSADQKTAIVAAVTALLALAAGFVQRSQVTPEAKAKARVNMVKTQTEQAQAGQMNARDEQIVDYRDQAENARSVAQMIAAVHSQPPIAGPAPANMLHPMAADPDLPEVTEQ